MLKVTTLILGTLISCSAMASTHGGGILMKNAMMRTGNGAGTMDALFGTSGGGGVFASTNGGGTLSSKEIIFHIGQKDGMVKFAYGHLIENKWQIQKIEMPESDLAGDAAVMKALQDSKSLKSWAEIK